MIAPLYVKRDTAPSLIAGDEVLVWSRDQGATAAPPRFYVVGLEPGSTFSFQTLQGPYDTAGNYTSGGVTFTRGQRSTVVLSAATSGDHNVYLLRCDTGRIAVTLVSPHAARMEFRRPEFKSA